MVIAKSRSPWIRERGDPAPVRRVGSQSLVNARADSGHRARHPGQEASQPVSAKRDSTPVVGGRSHAVYRDLDRP